METLPDKQYLFESMPVPKAVAQMCIPGIFGMVVTALYSIADTYFVGALNSPNQSAAVSLASAALYLPATVSSLFGVGTSSLISRKLGEQDCESAKKASAIGLWHAAVCALLISAAFFLFPVSLTKLLGADEQTVQPMMEYLFWTMGIGSIPSVLNTVLSKQIAAEGYANHASLGTMSGCILNIVLDPLFILPQFLNMNAAGAGLATMLSNSIAALYYVVFLMFKGNRLCTNFKPSNLCWDMALYHNIMAIGIPAGIQSLTFVVNSAVRNNIISSYGADVVAAYGIAYKTAMIPVSIICGASFGVLPLIGYNYSSFNIERMKAVYKYTIKFVMALGIAFFAVIFVFANKIMCQFIKNEFVISAGALFLRISAITLVLMAGDYVCVGVYQACGNGKCALITALSRKAIEIPAMLLLNMIIPPFGMAFGEPVAELVIGVVLYVSVRRYFNSLAEKVIIQGEKYNGQT